MRSMVLQNPGQKLQFLDLPMPIPQPHQVLLKVHACGVCQTDFGFGAAAHIVLQVAKYQKRRVFV